jgi:cyclic pyranopterin phosphate synthase
MAELTHFDDKGRARMVDVSHKEITVREAVARGRISMTPTTFQMIQDKTMAKGDVLGVARIAGIMATKRTAALIPLCHPLNITSAGIEFFTQEDQSAIDIEARVKTDGKTGVEMEAFMAVAIAAVTIYDMCKAVDRAMVISDIRLVEKRGGKSGTYVDQNHG